MTEFIQAIDESRFGNMSSEQARAFCDKCVEKDITMNDVLYSIMLLAREQERLQNSMKEHIERGVHG